MDIKLILSSAGGDYIFSDLNADKTGTQEMGIESFYEKSEKKRW